MTTTNPNPAPVTPRRNISRRGFLLASIGGAGGLCLGFNFISAETKGARAAAITPASGDDRAVTAAAPIESRLNAFLTIDGDGAVTINFGGCEFGQGTKSGFCQVVADELRVDWRTVQANQSDAAINPATGAGISYPTFMTNGAPVNILYATGGSGAFRNGNRFAVLRTAGATAREMLITAGAAEMGVPRDQCSAANGTVVVTGTSQSRKYGELAAKAALLPVPTVTIADPAVASFQLIGQRLPRLDIPAKTNGSAVYGLDVRLPGMLYAAVKHSPGIGGVLSKPPATPAGAKFAFPLVAEVTRGAVQKGATNAVAVVADNTWLAIQGAKSLKATWANPAATAAIDSASILAQAQTLMTTGAALPGESSGDPDGLLSGATASIDSTYSFPYVPHVCMEVMNATVRYTPTSCELWVPTQNAAGCAVTAKGLTGFTGDKVIVHTTYLGGGLGRKIEQDYVSQAVQTAMALYKKTGSGVVKLMWPREEDFANDMFRPMALVRVQAGLKAGGVALKYRTVTPSIRVQRGGVLTTADSSAIEGAAASLYGFAARNVEHVVHPAGVPVGYWRSVGYSINTFALECAIDELASKAAIDPLEFRRQLLTANSANPKAVRALAVVNAAAALSSWRTSLPAGHAWGIAFAESFGSLVCQIADISQPAAGSIKVHRVACAIDCGTAVNPGSIEAQMQGGIAHGLSAAFWGQQTFVKGVPQVKNFNAYRMLRASDMPQVAVSIVNSGAAIGGVGEPGVPPIGPAVANAYFRLTGTRIRALPFFPNAGGLADG